MYTLKTCLNICLKALCLSGFLFFLTLNGLAQTANTTAPQTFEKVKVLLLKDGKTREVSARLRFTGTEVVIEDASGKVLLTATNDEVKAAEYSRSKHNRMKPLVASGIAILSTYPLAFVVGEIALVSVVAGVVSLPLTVILAFTHSKKHLLTLRTGKEVVMLRLDKSHYRSVIAALENQTQLTVAWQGER
jgi:hypothetical protein